MYLHKLFAIKFQLLLLLLYIKCKVKLPCASTEHHAMKAYWGVEV